MLSLTIPTLETKVKEPLQRKLKSLLQEFLDLTNEIKVDTRLKQPEQEIEKRKSRFAAQEKFKTKLFDIITNFSSDISIMKNMIFRKMYPESFEPLTAINILNASFSKDQLEFTINHLIDSKKYEVVFYMNELFERDYKQGGEYLAEQFLKEIREKVKKLKTELGISQAEQEIIQAQSYLNELQKLYNHLINQVDLLAEGFDKVDSNTLQLIYETKPELYEIIEKYSYSPGANSFVKQPI